MRNFIISFVCLACIIVIWYGFHFYSHHQTDFLQQKIDTVITEHIADNNWFEAEKDIRHVSQNWEDFKKIASYFLDEESLDDVDCAIKQTYYYILERDHTASIGELSYLKERITLLHQTEELTLENIF